MREGEGEGEGEGERERHTPGESRVVAAAGGWQARAAASQDALLAIAVVAPVYMSI